MHRPRAQTALQYDTTLGLRPLRHQLLAHLEKLEGKPASSMSLTADDIVLTTGSQQTLYLVGDSLIDPGDIVIAANPSYFVFTGTLQSLGAQVKTVPADDDGMDVEALADLLGRLERDGQLARVKFIYTTSFFDNPTGLTLSLPRRKRMLEIVKQFSRDHRILILEDKQGTGRADKVTVFADKLSIPTSLAFWKGGVIVHQAPHTSLPS